jgi:hypothetical protein
MPSLIGRAILAFCIALAPLLVSISAASAEEWFRHDGGPLPRFIQSRGEVSFAATDGVVMTPPPGVPLFGAEWNHAQRAYSIAFSVDNMNSGCSLSWGAESAPDVSQEALNSALRSEPPRYYRRDQQEGAALGSLSYFNGGGNTSVRWWARRDGATWWHSFTVILRNNQDAVFAHRFCWSPT